MHLYSIRAEQVHELLHMISVVQGVGDFYSWTISVDQQTLNVYLVDDPLSSEIATTPVNLDPVIPSTPLPPPPPLTLSSLTPNTAELGSLDITLICRGLGFRDTSVIVIDDVIQETTYVSPEELTMILVPANFNVAGVLPVQVQQDALLVPPVGLPFTLTGIPITAVTAGTPGTFSPPGAELPANLTAIQAMGALGQTTSWLPGQYVILENASECYWSGTAWTNGRAPALATGATAGVPGAWTPSGASIPANIAALTGATPPVVASPATAWAVPEYVVLGDASHAFWNGTAWTAGH